MKVAVDKGLTFHDASYVYFAEAKPYLVSEDKELIKEANAVSLKEFIRLWALQ